MLVFLRRYVMQQTFKVLDEKSKILIYKHLIERAQMAEKEKELLAPPKPEMGMNAPGIGVEELMGGGPAATTGGGLS